MKGAQRVMTDMSGERFWTVIAEQEVETLEQYLDLSRQTMTDARVQKIYGGANELMKELIARTM